MIIEKEENQAKKTPLNLENLVQPLESKIKPYNLYMERFTNNNQRKIFKRRRR